MVASGRTHSSHSLLIFCFFHLNRYLIKQHNLITFTCLQWTKKFFHWESIVQLGHLQFWGSAVRMAEAVRGSTVSACPLCICRGWHEFSWKTAQNEQAPSKAVLCAWGLPFSICPTTVILWAMLTTDTFCLTKWHFPVQKQIWEIFTLSDHYTGIRDHLRQIFPSYFFPFITTECGFSFPPQSSSPPDPCPWFLLYSS